jgi:sterol desaturase/sphingolipid hydroxylase (fatty acid hydroxylase superfamily)
MIAWILLSILYAAVAIEIVFAREKYGAKDTLTNIIAYAGHLAVGFLWGPVLFEIYSIAHDHALLDLGPFWLDPSSRGFWAAWLALFVLDDFTFYWFHRASHRAAILWASHVSHHSSRRFNLSVGLRQTWTTFVAAPFWLWLPLLGFDPLMVLAMQLMSLFYQAWLHNEHVPKLGPLELVFNTPTHHRVHHGANQPYVDKNFGGVLIIWDRMFGTFAELRGPVRYGIDREVDHPLAGIHGWIDLLRSKLTEEAHP